MVPQMSRQGVKRNEKERKGAKRSERKVMAAHKSQELEEIQELFVKLQNIIIETQPRTLNFCLN